MAVVRQQTIQHKEIVCDSFESVIDELKMLESAVKFDVESNWIVGDSGLCWRIRIEIPSDDDPDNTA